VKNELQRGLWLHSPSPGSNGCVSTAVRMKDGQRVRGARITLNRDKHAAACGQRIENARVVRLETDASHRTRQSKFREVSAVPLQDADERSSCDRAADAGQVDPLTRRIQHSLYERRSVRTVPGEDGQRLERKAGLNQRVDALLGPREVLKHPHREQRDVGLDHGGNVSR